MPELSRTGDDVESGIQTEAILEGDRPGYWVTWIEWDSDFRRELQLGDLVIAVDGRTLEEILLPGKNDVGIGMWNEGNYFASHGMGGGHEVALTVWRGEQQVVVRGKLRNNHFYYTADGKRAIAPGGPEAMARDDFDEAWSGWQEKFTEKMSYVLTRGWRQRSFNTRYELGNHLEERPRIDYLLAHHPGAFADAMAADWERVRACIAGKRVELSDADLAYRSLGEQRVAAAKQAAAQAWAAFRAELAPETVPAFPAPEITERKRVAGKVVELPQVGEQAVINDLGRAYTAIGNSSDGWYFVALEESPEIDRLWDVIHRYRGRVDPQFQERFKYVARIKDDPRMLTVNRRAASGFVVQVLGVLAGDDELFVDLRRDQPEFAGEAALQPLPAAAHDDGSPASVIAAMIQAVKLGDEETWTGLFAPWRLVGNKLDTQYAPSRWSLADDWERSRRTIMEKVFDARIDAVDRVRLALRGDPANGVPEVEEVTVWVDHFGLFDGEYHAFNDINVHREWQLQRADGGAWRITSAQAL